MDDLAFPGLAQEVRRYGKFDVNGCLNCGSCTVVCDLSEGSATFPRKSIQRVLLGLRGSLHQSLDPWLCHDCGDCSVACPRQAEPRESMMTLRRYLAAKYDFTRISSRILTSKTWEMIGLLFIAALVFVLALLYHLYYVELPIGDLVTTPMGMEHMFNTIVYFTYAVFLIPLLIMTINAIRMFRFSRGDGRRKIPLRNYLVEAWTIVAHAVSQMNMRKCAEAIENRRWIKHWLLTLAFALKCVLVIFFLRWFQTDNIYPFYHPQRMLGYLVAAILVFVPAEILFGRIRKLGAMHKFSEFSDFVLPVMLLLVALSGLMVHVFRYLEFSLACHYSYALHLAIVVSLVVVELPFGKLSHVMYRPFALYLQAVRERALAEEVSPVELIPKEVATI